MLRFCFKILILLDVRIQRLSVDLPNKHGRGGQSSVRFARLRLERRAAYILKVAELCTQHFITGDRPNIKGLILAGSADLKNELHTSDHLDPRLCSLVLKVVDTAYGGDNGLQEAIAQSADAISAAHILLERSALQEFFEHVARDSGRYAFGHVDTLAALSAGAVERLLVHEELGTVRYELSFPDGSSTVVCQDVESAFEDGGATIVSAVPLVEWLAENYSRYGATLTLISGNSPEGQQFVRGFGGVGAILRWALSLAPMEEVITEDE